MKTLRHITEQPFIFATGIAALIHSTWALGTLFSGIAPDVAFTWEYISWIVPAVLIAFALDVGQISTSGQIREHGLTVSRMMTFVIFAFATYYLQWLYMAVHMPLLDISDGVTGIHYNIALSLRNVGIWLIPALLPISTISYTFSGEKQASKKDYVDTAINIKSLEDDYDLSDTQPAPVINHDDSYLLQEPVEPETFSIDCPECEWHGQDYSEDRYAQQALKMHMKKAHGIDIDEVQS